jgi:hypothetical protein
MSAIYQQVIGKYHLYLSNEAVVMIFHIQSILIHFSLTLFVKSLYISIEKLINRWLLPLSFTKMSVACFFFRVNQSLFLNILHTKSIKPYELNMQEKI